MADVRFPYKAFYRRLAEAEGLDNATLEKWKHDRIKAKRRAAETVLKRRGYIGSDVAPGDGLYRDR